MDIEEFRKYCLSVNGAEESIFLQNRNVLVCKIMGKVFVYIPLEPKDCIFKAYLKKLFNFPMEKGLSIFR